MEHPALASQEPPSPQPKGSSGHCRKAGPGGGSSSPPTPTAAATPSPGPAGSFPSRSANTGPSRHCICYVNPKDKQAQLCRQHLSPTLKAGGSGLSPLRGTPRPWQAQPGSNKLFTALSPALKPAGQNLTHFKVSRPLQSCVLPENPVPKSPSFHPGTGQSPEHHWFA